MEVNTKPDTSSPTNSATAPVQQPTQEQPEKHVNIPQSKKNKKGIIITILLALSFVVVLAVIVGGLLLKNRTPGKSDKVYHVGILSGLDFFSVITDSFKDEMANLGYIEGENIIYYVQNTNFEPEKEKQILKKFVEDDVDLIFTFPTEVSLTAKEAIQGTNIPLVFAAAFVEDNNLIDSIRQPGGNVTGVRYPNTDVAAKRLEVLHEIMPDAKRVWLPYQYNYPSVPAELEAVKAVAEPLGITLIEFPATDITHLESELEKRAKDNNFDFDAVLYIPESLSTTRAVFDVIASYTRKRKIPIMGTTIETDDYGTVFGVTTNNPEFGLEAAPIADKILKGTQAGTIPVVSVESHIKLNYKVAQELGLTLPEGLVSRASEIIR